MIKINKILQAISPGYVDEHLLYYKNSKTYIPPRTEACKWKDFIALISRNIKTYFRINNN